MQLALSFTPETHARKTDPNTSKLAAERLGFAESHCGRILACLPGTLDELADRTGLSSVQIARRLPDLQKAQLAVPSVHTKLSKAGRQERIWFKL
jgi:predicted ArsR family transcriptional regulator